MAQWSEWQLAEGWKSEEVLYHKKYRLVHGGGVARVMVNRPEVLNATAGVHWGLMATAVREATRDPAIGVIVITGAGDHFGTGGDVRWEAQGGLNPDSELRQGGDGGNQGGPNTPIWHSSKPVIAAVKGYCIGASHHLHYHCDFTIAADTAIFGRNGPRVASPAHGETVAMLAHIVGMKRAKEIWMLCRQYTAQEALDMGLVNTVVPVERLDEEVDQWCDELLNLHPDCLAIVKQSFNAVGSNLWMESGRIAAMITPNFHFQPSVKEAQQAFFQRRVPNFWEDKLPEALRQ